jgi:hypothetical protein
MIAPENRHGPPYSSSTLFENLVASELPAQGMALIEVDASSIKTMRRALWMIGFLPVAYCALLPLLLQRPASSHGAATAEVIHRVYLFIWTINTATLAVVIAFIVRVMRRRMRMRIGTDGGSLLFDNGGGTLRRFEWNDVYTDTRTLLIGRDRIALYASRTRRSKTVFPAEALRENILARLPASSFVSATRLAWIAMTRSSVNTRLLYGAIVLMFALAQYLKYHRNLTEPLRAALRTWLTP